MSEPIKYVTRPRAERDVCLAARYERGSSLHGVLAVARRADRDATIAELPELDVLVVRHLRVPDHHPAHVEYEVIPDGDMLVYSDAFDLLYTTSVEEFEREHTPV